MDERHHRRSIRLPGYDYSSDGAYFVTICTKNREQLFGKIEDGEVRLNDVGESVEHVWLGLPKRYQNIETDEYAVMPNHFHGIVWINGVGAPLAGARAGTRPAPTLGDVIGGFKSLSTVGYVKQSIHNPPKLWQRNYFERVIRDDAELDRIRRYILDNPANWATDPENHPYTQTPTRMSGSLEGHGMPPFATESGAAFPGDKGLVSGSVRINGRGVVLNHSGATLEP